MFNKKEFIQQKFEEVCLILRNIILRAAYSIFRTRDTMYQLMSVDIECPWSNKSYFKINNNRHLSC